MQLANDEYEVEWKLPGGGEYGRMVLVYVKACHSIARVLLKNSGIWLVLVSII